MSPTSSGPILHPTRRHPMTGKPLEAAGVLPSGRIVWPILGGDDTVVPVERPEGVSEEEWNALGDPGKAAIVRQREENKQLRSQLAAAQARPAAPKAPEAPAAPAKDPAAPSPAAGDQPDIAAIVKQAVDAAIKPFQERDQQRSAEEAAGKVRDAVLAAAKPLLQDETDAVANIDLTKVVNDQGQADLEKVKAELDDLLTRKPHLAKSPQRFAPAGIGGGAPAAATDAEKVKAVLADMQRATGIRVPSTN